MKSIFKKTIFIFIILTTILESFLVITFVSYWRKTEINDLAKLYPKTNINIYDKNNILIANLSDTYQSYTPYYEIPKVLVDATLSIEDSRFFEHDGLDYEALVRSIIANIKSKSFSQGASTITQQLIKNVYLSNEKTLDRKINEAILALKLEKILTKEFSNSPVKTMHLFAYYRGNLQMNFYPTDNDLNYDYNDIDVGINGKFQNEKMFYEARLRFTPQDNYDFLQFLPSNMYIGTTAIPHHTVMVGNMRTPNGVEGSTSSTRLPFVARSQISRNFANTRQVGVKVKGNYSLVEYDLGGFSSDTYFRKFMPGAEFAGWLTLKPLGKTNGKYGALKLGSGITAGENDTSYCVTGAYDSYEYKKFLANFEWAKANGYNGAKGISTNKAEGFYTTLGYKITPKVQLVARYDQFKPNLNNSSDIRREYSGGVNYFAKTIV